MEGEVGPQGEVLVVEDAEGEHAHLRRALAQRGHRVAATRSEDAPARIEAERPDVVLVGASRATALLDALPAEQGVTLVPVLVLCEGEDVEERVALLRAGALRCFAARPDPLELEAQVGAAVAVGRRYSLLRELALTDPLTGLGNRRHGENELAQVVARSTRHGYPLGLALVDLDGFKAVNDTHGHDVGDTVLREAGARLSACLRGGDTLVRWGGEEFVAILPDTEPAGVLHTAGRLCRSVGCEPFPHGTTRIELTVSVGWADWRGEDPREYVLRADRALYDAKGAGRNTVRPQLDS